MVRAERQINVSDMPELLKLAEEVRSTGASCLLRRDGVDLAVVKPVTSRRKRRSVQQRADADHQAFLASAGGWKDLVDTDKFIEDNHESRRRSIRPQSNMTSFW